LLPLCIALLFYFIYCGLNANHLPCFFLLRVCPASCCSVVVDPLCVSCTKHCVYTTTTTTTATTPLLSEQHRQISREEKTLPTPHPSTNTIGPTKKKRKPKTTNKKKPYVPERRNSVLLCVQHHVCSICGPLRLLFGFYSAAAVSAVCPSLWCAPCIALDFLLELSFVIGNHYAVCVRTNLHQSNCINKPHQTTKPPNYPPSNGCDRECAVRSSERCREI